jgi:predicted transcriptional regulator
MSSNISATLIADVLSYFQIPGTGTAMGIYESILEKRRTAALNILLMEIRQGNFSNLDQDETVSVIARYLRDAQEGAAKNNLKFLAKTIKGMAEEENLLAITFNRYSSVIAALTPQEMELLGFIEKEKAFDYLSQQKKFDERFPKTDLYPVFQSLMRFGLIAFHTGVESKYTPAGYNDYGDYEASVESESWTNYETTDLFSEIMSYASLLEINNLED